MSDDRLAEAVRYLRAKARWWGLGYGWGWREMQYELALVAETLERGAPFPTEVWEEDFRKEDEDEHG